MIRGFRDVETLMEQPMEPVPMEEPQELKNMEVDINEITTQDTLNRIERRNEERRARERRIMGELIERNEERQYEDRENQPQSPGSGSISL